MSLARRIREEREKIGFSLEELAEKAKISKTYLWELENDTKGVKKPSAELLLRVAQSLSITIADLISLPFVRTDSARVDLSKSLVEFRDWMKKIGEPLTESELLDLATMRFRGGQPRTKEDWHDLYRTLRRTTGK